MLRSPRFLVLHALLAVLLPAVLAAQPAFLVKDINTSTDPLLSSPFQDGMVAADGLVFFPLDDGIHGMELWRSDGTEAGTFLLADICPGICASQPGSLTPLGGFVYFSTGINSPTGGALWKTDGTQAGTVKVLDLDVQDIAQVNGKLLLSAGMPPLAEWELWVSDGTAAGTAQLADIWPGFGASTPSFLGQAGSDLFFRATDPTHGRELWKTDGTLAGTALVKDLVPGSDSAFVDPIPFLPDRDRFPTVGSRLFFRVAPAEGIPGGGLWVTDGTDAGTYRINDLVAWGNDWTSPQGLTVRGGDLFFFALSGSTWELAKTDGTAAGTVLLRTGNVVNPDYSHMGVLGTTVFFAGIDGAGAEPWTTDGTAVGTARFADLAPGAADGLDNYYMTPFTPLGSSLLFFANDHVHGQELWTSDGTAGGTSLLADLNPGPLGSYGFAARVQAGAVVGGRWFFDAADTAGWALWVSDGTAAGTQIVRRFPYQSSAFNNPPLLAPLGAQLAFAASPQGSVFLPQLWKTDGSGGGTVQLAPGSASPLFSMSPLNNLVLYDASGGGLWRTDGTDGGTWQIPGTSGFPRAVVQAGSLGFFTNQSDFNMWSTDGSSASVLVAGQSSWNNPTAFGDHLLFTPLSGAAVWLSDGTPAGTATVPGETAYSEAGNLTPAGDRFFFGAYTSPAGTELWVKEPAAAQARLVKDINPGSNGSLLGFDAFAALGRNVVFPATDGTAGEELWTSDGTASGTVRLADIRPGPASSGIADLTAGYRKVFFTADDGTHGRELWVTDGTPAGTHLVRDIVPGAGSSSPQQLRTVGHVLLFSAFDAAHGLELWRSDGTEAGTYLLQDIAAGPGPSSPQGFTVTGSYVYFTANDNVTGFELWAIPRAALGSFLTATKTVAGQGAEGATVTYTIVITNVGAGPSADNPGDEMSDVLPPGLTLLDASATAGTTAVDIPNHRVSWNGALPAGGTATVTIHAQVNSGAFPGVLLNQATLAFDADGNGTNESTAVSDGPAAGAPTPLYLSLAAADLFTVAPCRIADTRTTSALASGVARSFPVTGICGIPAGAKAIAANVTVVSPTGAGYLSIYPNGTAAGTTTVNFATGQTRSGNAMLALKNGAVDAKALVSGGGTVQVVIDVSGYFQ